MNRLTRGGTTETVSRGRALRREQGQGERIFGIFSPFLADHGKDSQPYTPLDAQAAIHESSNNDDTRNIYCTLSVSCGLSVISTLDTGGFILLCFP